MSVDMSSQTADHFAVADMQLPDSERRSRPRYGFVGVFAVRRKTKCVVSSKNTAHRNGRENIIYAVVSERTQLKILPRVGGRKKRSKFCVASMKRMDYRRAAPIGKARHKGATVRRKLAQSSVSYALSGAQNFT